VGNKADVSGNDLIEYWQSEDATKVILLYLENFGNPRRFTTLARQVTRTKPVIVVKSGRTKAGARAAASHTGALAGVDVAIDALLAQCGVLRAQSVQELFDIAMAFENQPIPKGNRVAIITNAGGPGIMIADACESEGLDVVDLSADTQKELGEIFPAEASVRNPVDMIASATSDSYRLALQHVLADPNVDAAIAAFVPPLGVRQVDVASAIVEACEGEREKPVLAVLMGRQGFPEGRAELHEAGIPAYTFPESAARALDAMVRYRRWLDRPVQEPTHFEVDKTGVASIIAGARSDGRTALKEHEALAVLDAYGVPVAPYRFGTTLDEVRSAAEACGYPVVLKAVAPGVLHKTDVGAVHVDVRSQRELDDAFGELVRSLGREEVDLEGILVQSFVSGGRETIIGMSTDPSIGPILMFGLGGIYVEALGDVSFRLAPVSEIDAREMLESIRGSALLGPMRGGEGLDREALVEAVQRISQLVIDHPDIVELDVNPFLGFVDGGLAVDCRVSLRPHESGPKHGSSG